MRIKSYNFEIITILIISGFEKDELEIGNFLKKTENNYSCIIIM
jgi:hypothetical protein